MNLTIDIGNSGVKTGVFKKNKLVYFNHIKSPGKFSWEKFVTQHDITNAIICSVVDDGKQIVKALSKSTSIIYFNEATKIPIKNKYKAPQTLGKDRLAVAIAGADIFPKRNVLIVQLGSCLTFDFINSKNEYMGGAISPGLNMRFRALNTFTAKLPLLTPENISYRLGTTTHESILSGVINGMRDEIDGAIDAYRKKYKGLKVILTGGDAYFYESQLKNEIFAQPNLVLYGLNKILEHNAEKKS